MASTKVTPASIMRYGHIAATLRQEMQKRGWNQSEFTRQLGAGSTSVIAPWLASRGAPGPDYRKRLAELLDLDESALMPRDLGATPPDLPAPRPNGAGRPPTSGRPPTRNRVFSFALNADGTVHVTLDLQTTSAKGMEILQFLLNSGIEQEAAPTEESE